MKTAPGKSPLPILFAFVIVDLLGFSLILPLLPYYAKTFNASALVIGLLGTANALAQVIAAPLIGRLSDRFGRRPLLLLGTFAGFACFVMLGAAQTLVLVFASRILNGLLGGNMSLAQAYITDVTDEKSRARSLGILGAAFGIGFVVGPALGGFLSSFGYDVPAYAAAGLALLNFLWILFALPESLSAERRAALAITSQPPITARAMVQAMRRPRVGPILSTIFFYNLAFGVFTASFALYALSKLDLSAQSTGYILAYVGIILVLVQGVAIGPLTARFSEPRLIVTAVAVVGVTLLAWGFVPNVPLLLVVMFPMAVAAGVLGTILSSSLTKSVSRDEVGGTLGISASLMSVTQVVAPVLGGFLLGWLGPWSLGVLGAAIMGGLTVYTWRKIVKAPGAADLPRAAGAAGG
jgi:MFS transporter, DHA1 family, tetracycline resistance protein